jgi:hypothetical protein
MFMGCTSKNRVLRDAEAVIAKMSSSTSSPLKCSKQALLRWSERNSPRREVIVQVVETHASEAVIRCGLQLSEKTKVYLMGDKFTRTGIVRACRSEGAHFLLTIRAVNEDFRVAIGSVFDPGIRAVEDFLTEEQEQEILDAL